MPEVITMYALLKELASWTPLVVLIFVAYAAAKINSVESLVGAIREDVTYLKVWTTMHEKADKDMFEQIQGRLHRIEAVK